VLGGGPDQVLRAIREAGARARESKAASGRRVVLLFYYSGHGDDDSLHLPRGTLPLAVLRRELASVPADLRVSILDACRGGSGRSKGIRRGPSFALAVSPDAPQGTVELRASSVGEAAQESESLGGAIFTHYLMSGLRGGADRDRDGRVTLAELYSYAYGKTLLRTGTGAALQHPAMALAVAGAGDIVLRRHAGQGQQAGEEGPCGRRAHAGFGLPRIAGRGRGLQGRGTRLRGAWVELPPGEPARHVRAGRAAVTRAQPTGHGQERVDPSHPSRVRRPSGEGDPLVPGQRVFLRLAWTSNILSS
jgi:hypothetical protein